MDTSAVAKDVKDIIDVKEEASYKWIWYVLGAVLLAAIGLGVYFYIRKKRKKVSEEGFGSHKSNGIHIGKIAKNAGIKEVV